jgi:RNA methyltransferase, TrmH family
MLPLPADMPARLPFRSVTSRQNPIVSRFREIARRDGSGDIVFVEGLTLTLEAARAGWKIEALAIAEPWMSMHGETALAEARGAAHDRIVVPHRVLLAMSPTKTPSGVVALARLPARDADPYRGPRALTLMADSIQDPGNAGALCRAAEAAGGSGLVLSGQSADPYGWRALRGSMGSAFRLPIAIRSTGLEAIAEAHAGGLQVLALTANSGTSIYDADLRGPVALFVGREGSGLDPALVKAADGRISIPMHPPVESLNVAVAAAVALYEARRQRSVGSLL